MSKKDRKSIFLKPLANRLGLFTGGDVKEAQWKAVSNRNFSGADGGRLFSDWISGNWSADTVLNGQLCVMRNRCRDLERNNDYASRYLTELVTNVIGEQGMSLQMRIEEPDPRGGVRQDKKANDMIEKAWKDFCKPQNASVSGDMSLWEMNKIALRSVCRDGDFIIRIVRGYNNKYGFAIQILEADYLAEDKNFDLGNGSYVRMGVEFNEWHKPVAYHMYREHPGETYQRSGGLDTYRLDASEIILPFIRHRAGQSRGYPWMASTMTRLKMLDAYEEAELVKVRASSCKMGFYTKQRPEDIPADEVDDGNPISNFSPGTIEELPMGADFKGWDPTATDANYSEYRKGVLRGVAAGLKCSYNILAQDLEGVNYSSLRGGLLDEREIWMQYQRWWIECVVEPIFTAWLEVALLSQIKLPMSKFEKYNKPEFRGRRWSWVDPMKDVAANLLAIEGGIKSKREVVEENGGDLEKVTDNLKAELEIAEEMGLNQGKSDRWLTPSLFKDE